MQRIGTTCLNSVDAVKCFKYGLSVIIVLISLRLLLVNVLYIWPFAVDDAFITFRYSSNLASGFGPNFNKLPPRAEGYTSFLWMAIMVLPHLFHWDSVLVAKALGVLFMVSGIILSYPIMLRLLGGTPIPDRYLLASFAPLMISVMPITALHAVSGMETALATFLLILFVFLAVLAVDHPSRTSLYALAFTGLLMGLARPEFNIIVFFVAIMLGALFFQTRERRILLEGLVLIYLLPGLIYFLWRYNYYGLLFPLPFYVKMEGRSFAGVPVVLDLFKAIAAGMGVFLLGSVHKYNRRYLLIWVPATLHIFYYLIPEHIMGYGWRLLFPANPIIAIASVLGLTNYYSFMKSSLLRMPFICVSVIWVIFSLYHVGNAEFLYRRVYADQLENAHVRLGKILAEQNDSNQLLAISDAGAVPYYSGWETIDIFGLNDSEIAMSGWPDPQYVMGRAPTVLVIASQDPDKMIPVLANQMALFKQALEMGMGIVDVLKFNEYYFLWVLATAPLDN